MCSGYAWLWSGAEKEEANRLLVSAAREEEGVALLLLKKRGKELVRELGLRENCCCVGVVVALLLRWCAAALLLRWCAAAQENCCCVGGLLLKIEREGDCRRTEKRKEVLVCTIV